MNQTTKVAVALIVAAGLSTMAYAIAEQNLANGAVTTPKIAPGAVSISTTQVFKSQIVQPGGFGEIRVQCPSGSTITGGGFATDPLTAPVVDSSKDPPNGWLVTTPQTTQTDAVFVYAECATTHP